MKTPLTKRDAIKLVKSYAQSVIHSYRATNDTGRIIPDVAFRREEKEARKLLVALTGEKEWSDDEIVEVLG